ncbi:malto-oligosyltrehalose synthase [Chelatococcus sp. GCM10030263]|uniref:malto-oligosyltrehalose synthase n=1 Tax=Chelatococcus sp. GCM10030263 TaxID=3273387 RepID=UPI00361D1E6B
MIAYSSMVPRATMRLQLHAGFTFADAQAAVPYMASLGVSHLYASPILTARSGSMHGYDVVDPTRVSAELGGEEGLSALVAVLRAHGMGLIVDIVPNHMGVGPDNPWWMDVLARGPASHYARSFDIDWEANDKIALPVLGSSLEECLAKGEVKLGRDDSGQFTIVAYGEKHYPLSTESLAELSGDAAALTAFDPASQQGRARLSALLDKQHYRLSSWRTANEALNWRRFFDINELAGLRIEDPTVFEEVQATIFRLYREGLIDGLRIDHVDGLADPRGYCRRLRRQLEALGRHRPPTVPSGTYIVVEKILAEGEELAADWATDGTTGYDFMSEVGALIHDETGEDALTALWHEVSGRTGDFAAEELQARREMIAGNLKAEFERAAVALDAIAGRDPEGIRRVLAEVVVHFPVYRTYAGAAGRPAGDRWVVERAFGAARTALPPSDHALIDDIERWLGGEAPCSLPPGPERQKRRAAIRRFQHLTAPVAAKSVEDTAFYRYGRLLSRNEVGADPGLFALAPEKFFALCRRRAEKFPLALLATATHDHKRGEDLRARLAVLSQCPEAWAGAVRGWMVDNADLRHGGAPDGADAYMLYQMIIGAWPLDLAGDDAQGLRGFAERLAGWQQKALREAKLKSSWSEPDEAYEAGCRAFLFALLDPAASRFSEEAAAFVTTIAAAGAANGLTQTLLRLTLPGVPDIYQGTEFWDFSLVDPDNRRPVDFTERQEALGENLSPAALLTSWCDGRLKQAVIARALAVRRNLSHLFAPGGVQPLSASGALASHIFAFARMGEGGPVIVIALRNALPILADDRPSVVPILWRDTAITLPAELTGAYRNVLTDMAHARGGQLMLSEVMGELSVALLVPA